MPGAAVGEACETARREPDEPLPASARASAATAGRLGGLALAWLAGVALHLQQAELASPAVQVAWLAGGGLCAVLALRFTRRRGLTTLLLLLVALLFGFGASNLRAGFRLAQSLPAALEGQDLQVTGVVASLPQRSASGLRFRFEIDAATRNGEPVTLPDTVALGWYAGWHEDAALTPPQRELRAGQRWRFTVRLRQPHGAMNPHGFDTELRWFEQGVRATGYVRDAPTLLLEARAGFPVERWRQRVRDAIDAAVADPRAAGVLAALSVGDQSAIDRDDWDLFRITGIAHLVSISGLHVTMFAWLAGAAIAVGWRRSTRAALWIATPHAARWGGLAAAGAYAVLSGWGVPSQRTVWMLATVTVLHSAGRRWPWPLVLLSAAVVVTALDPWALLQPGFWLSFMAVGLLMASGSAHAPAPASALVLSRWRSGLRRLWAVVGGGVKTQVVATIGLTPLTLVFFQQVSVVGFAANLVAIPLVTLVITPLALLGILVTPLWAVGAWCVQQLSAWLAWLAAFPSAVWSVPVAPAWAQAAGLLGAALLVMPLPWRVRCLALPLTWPLWMPPLDRPAEGAFDVVAVDVGQGTAVLLRTREHLMVYDAGPQYSRDTDAGQRVLLPLLRARGETRINQLVLSHRDADHVGGAAALLRGLPVGELLSSIEPQHPLRGEAVARGGVSRRCEAGQSWRWDGVQFDVLLPQAASYDRGLRSNALSCVLRVSGTGGSVLLTGDIEREGEQALVATLGDALRSDVLIVPHHGSKTSSSDAFLQAVSPRVGVIQSGYRNRFGHPAGEVTARYQQRGIALRTSPWCGAWQWRALPGVQAPGSPLAEAAPGDCHRDKARRYWTHSGTLTLPPRAP